MGKVIERVKITNVFEPGKSIEIDALIDTGATMVVLPQDIVRELGLRKVREVKVRYANNKVEMKPLYRAVVIEILGREGTLPFIKKELFQVSKDELILNPSYATPSQYEAEELA